ncbi:MAG: hypothetical protein H3C26_04425 [Rhodocyclaceae bacterium]|nr:hypothetical protein [Rhodocyclaceae bacterium]
MQLDIFRHSRDVALRNALIDAMKRRATAAVDSAAAALAAEYPADALLPDAAELCRWLRTSLPQADAAAALADMEGRIEPAARRVLGNGARAWLAPCWQELARTMAGQAFDPDAEALHAAPLFLRAGDWRAAVTAVESIPAWRRRPAPLGWMIEARRHLDGAAAVWPMLAELAWMAPQRARRLLPRLADDRLASLLRRFDSEFAGSDGPDGFSLFPAWLLVEDGSFAAPLKSAEQGRGTGPERCARLVVTLLGLERQGRHDELIESRRRLRDLDGALFEWYMRSR